jgi:peptidoglycan hydrolase CwlO-like protein
MKKELDEREKRIKMLEMESDEYKAEIELTKRTIGELKKTFEFFLNFN